MTERKEFDHGLQEIKTLLIAMGERVQWALEHAMDSLQTSNVEQAKLVFERDHEINLLERQIDDLGTQLILKQQPVAKDLRKILVGFRIAADLERMGDLARDIANVTVRLAGQPLIKPLIDLPAMAKFVHEMIHQAIDSYLREDIVLAESMAKSDDQVDALYSKVLRDLFALMSNESDSVNQAMLLCFVGRFIERIADHATNIGEGVVYLVKNQRSELN